MPKLARMPIALRELPGLILCLAPCAAIAAPAERPIDGARGTAGGSSSPGLIAAENGKLERVDALVREFDESEKPESLRAASALLDELAQSAPPDYGLHWRRARIDQILGVIASDDDEKLSLFDRAIQSGKAAVKSKPDGVEGHYWLGTSYGCYGEVKGMLKALSMIDDIRDEMQAVIKIDAKYDDAGAYLVLGKIDFELPGWLGGSSKRAIEEYEQGLKLAPSNALMKLYLSDSYYDAGRRDEAKKLLEEIIALKLDLHSTRDARRAQREAKKSFEKRFTKKKRRDSDY